MSSSSNKPLIPPSTSTHTTKPHDNDVLCGRGGTINAHPGNEQYRKFVERKKRVYLTARFKREKRLIASSIVEEVRSLDPPGRFLTKDPHSDTWYDVGDEKARDKTSQALRENALSVRKAMEEEFQETRRRQAREVAIAAGRDPDEAVKNMMNAAGGKVMVDAAKAGQAKSAMPQPPPGVAGFMGRSGYGPLYEAQRPALQQWPPAYGAPPPHPHGAPHPPPPPGHYPPHPQGSYFQPPPPPGSIPPPPASLQPPQHAQYSFGGPPPPQPQPPHHSAQQAPAHPHHSQPGMPPHPPQYWPPPSNPQHQQPSSHQQPPPPHQHTINQPPMLAPRPSTSHATPPASVTMPVPSSIGHPSTIDMKPTSPLAVDPPPPPRAVMGTIDRPAPPSTGASALGGAGTVAPPGAAAATPPIAVIVSPGDRRSSGSGSDPPRHVQFRNEPPSISGPATADIPLIISSKKRIQPRPSSMHSPPRSGGTIQPAYSPIRSSRQGDSSARLSPLHPGGLSPRSQAGTSASQAMTQSQATQATNLTFLSADLSVKTSDSLSHFLRGMEDEITGDVGQEVELVAHAPMLEPWQKQQDRQPPMEHHNHRQIQQQRASNMYTRSTPPRHHSHHSSGSSHKSSSSRRRKRRSGNHIPSNSGKVQVDWSTAAAPVPGTGGISCGAGGALAPGRNIFVGIGAPVAETTPPVASSPGVLPCGDNAAYDTASASCGGILPTPLRSSNAGPNRSPTTSAMPSPPGPGTLTPTAPGQAPLSPGSLDLEKMSLCGTENVSQTGGSIGGASLCHVFDDNEDRSIIGASALMDMTMSLGSHPSSGPSDPSVGGGNVGAHGGGGQQQMMGLQSMPFGLNPHGVFGGDENESLCVQTLMDMSVGSGAQSHGGSKADSRAGSQGSKTSSSSRSKSGRGSPASIDKASLEGGKMEHDEQGSGGGKDQFPLPAAAVNTYVHDFKFTWDGKREE